METEKKFAALVEIIGDSQMTTVQIADKGGCLLTNGCRENLRYYLDKMVDCGILQRVKVSSGRRPLRSAQFGKQPCKWAYRKAGGEI